MTSSEVVVFRRDGHTVSSPIDVDLQNKKSVLGEDLEQIKRQADWLVITQE